MNKYDKAMLKLVLYLFLSIVVIPTLVIQANLPTGIDVGLFVVQATLIVKMIYLPKKL